MKPRHPAFRAGRAAGQSPGRWGKLSRRARPSRHSLYLTRDASAKRTDPGIGNKRIYHPFIYQQRSRLLLRRCNGWFFHHHCCDFFVSQKIWKRQLPEKIQPIPVFFRFRRLPWIWKISHYLRLRPLPLGRFLLFVYRQQMHQPRIQQRCLVLLIFLFVVSGKKVRHMRSGKQYFLFPWLWTVIGLPSHSSS